MKVKVTQSCPTLCNAMDYTVLGILQTRILEWVVFSLSLLQGIFPTQGSNPGLLHWRRILYQLSHRGSPRILEWVAYPFSSGSSQPRSRIGLSCLAGRLFANWAIREGMEANSEQPLWVKHSVSCVILDTEKPNLALEQLTVEEGSRKHMPFLCSWNSPGKNPGVGSHLLFQGICPT